MKLSNFTWVLEERLMISNYFYDEFLKIQEDREKVAEYIRQYNAKREDLKEYLIAFTPRSGSSWLNELLTQTKLAGNPEEWFNHEHLSGILSYYQCVNIQDYIRCIKADQSSANGYFGLESTFFQLRLVLEGCSFDQLLHNPKVIYLIRRDFVSQGISLYKAVETGYFHSVQQDGVKAELVYDADKIKYWILHILQQESYWEQFFIEHGFSPLRLTYEELVHSASNILKRMFEYLEIPYTETDIPQNSKHSKIADKTNQMFYELFHEQMSEFIDICNTNRGKPELVDIWVE